MNEKHTPNPLTASYPALPVSDDLRLRVKRLAAQHDDQRRPARKTHPVFQSRRVLVYGAAALLLGAGAALQPRLATATALSRMSAALEGVHSAHLIQWQTRSVTDPTLTRSESWFSGDLARIENDRGTQIFRDGKNYFYSPEHERVLVKAAEGPARYNSSGFTIASLQRDLTRWGWQDKLERLGPIQKDGKHYQQVAITRAEPAGTVRILLLVDPKTDLPQKTELSLLKDGQWKVFGGSELRYNEALPDTLFTPRFPGARVVDLDQQKKLWKERIESVVAEVKLGERTVKIRDVRVNEQGAIFVLYTCGKTYEDGFSQPKGDNYRWPKTPRDWEIHLPGYRQQEIPFSGFVGTQRKTSALGTRPILADGELLQGDWFTPLSVQTDAPKTIALQLNAHPKNLHGDQLNREHWSGYRQVVRSGYPQRQSWSALATLPLTPEPQSGFLPDYWSALVNDFESAEEAERTLRLSFEEVRIETLMTHRATLSSALESLALQEKLTPYSPPPATLFLKRATVLGLLGRRAEAEQALQTALTHPTPNATGDDYFYWEQVCTAWYAIGDAAKAIEARERALALAQPKFPGRVTWYRQHPDDLKPKLEGSR